MNVLKGPEKNTDTTLDISATQSNRILVGLSWDPKLSGWEERPKAKDNPDILDKAAYYIYDVFRHLAYVEYQRKSLKQNDLPERKENSDYFDLDLHCYVFDSSGNLKQKLGPDYKEAIDPTSSTYHSGEDFSGTGGPDDEQIHIETKNIPDEYKHFIFFVRSDCKFSLDEINDPVVRLADSKTETNFLEVAIRPPANLDAYGFIFAHVYHENGEWHVKNLSEYAAFDIDWEEELKKYL